MNTSLSDMCRFLESLYIDFGDGTGCLRESPNVEKDRCYTNTNSIALAVLRMCNSSIVPRIEAFLNKYNHEYGGRFEVMFLHDIPYPPRVVKRLTLDTKTVDNETITIYADIPSDTIFENWNKYADLSMLVALHYLLNQDFTNAWRARGFAQSMWTGRGFGDLAYISINQYDVYKLSLYYFLMRALRHRDSIVEWIEKNIDRFISNGGVITNYDDSLTPIGDPNVETTSVTALAFYSDYPERFPLYIIGYRPTPIDVLEKNIRSIINMLSVLGAITVAIKIISKRLQR